jgi:hypothetical protein
MHAQMMQMHQQMMGNMSPEQLNQMKPPTSGHGH